MDRIRLNTTPFIEAGEALKEKFGGTYISFQIDIMLKMQTENLTEAIGKAKEFIESCCKTIFEECRLPWVKDCNVSKLVKETMKILEIATENVDATSTEGETVKPYLGIFMG